VESMEGTVLKGVGSFYTVRDENGNDWILRCMKKVRRERLSPLPGDQVLFCPEMGEKENGRIPREPGGDRDFSREDGTGGEVAGWIEKVLPRKTLCLRPPVANVTRLVIVLAPMPEPDLLLADRQIARAFAQHMEILIVVNKMELDPGLAARLRNQYLGAEIPVFPVSALNRQGLEPLREAMQGALCCLTGQSGVGKSTLLNALLDLSLETGELSRKIDRGKNTTRHAELIEKDGLRIMDTAGFSLLEPEKAVPPEALKARYPEFLPLEGKCRFRVCLHDREPGCAVTNAVSEGMIHPERVERYRVLLAEAREEWRDRYD